VSKTFEYILKFTGDTKDVEGKTSGLQGTLKGAAVAAGALFSVAAVAAAGKAVFDYATQISSLRDNVESLTGLQGAALNKTTGAAQAISKTFDQDVNEVLVAANALSKQFGMEMTDSIELVKKGLASSANVNGDFLQQIKEYSTQFKAAGLEAENMVAIMSNAGSMGIYDDKGADVIKEGMLRIREMTSTTQDALRGIGIDSTKMQQDLAQGNITIMEAMQQVARKLNEFPESTAKVGTAIADIFGGPGEDAGLEYIKMLGTMDMGISGIMDSMTEATKAQYNWANAQEKFHTIGASVFGGTSSLITKVKTTLLNLVSDGIRGLVSLVNYFIDLYNESMLLRGAIQLAGANIKTVFEVGKLFVNQFFDALKNVGKLIKAVFTFDLQGIKDALKSAFSDSGNNIAESGRKIAENYSKAIENTLTPRKKIGLISLDGATAEAAGKAVGEAYAKGVQSTMSLGQLGLVRPAGIAKISSKTPGSIQGDPVVKKLSDSSTQIDLNVMAMEMLINKHNQYTEAVASSASSISGAFSSIGDAIGGAAGSWLEFAGNMLSQIPQIITQITALANAQIASSMAVTTAKQGEAAGSAAASAAALPFPANIAAMIAAVASVMGLFASFKAMPKMASGGMASGLSSVVVGDYPNAQANPEVIAPLNKLQNMLVPRMQPAAIRVYGTLEGRGRDFNYKIMEENAFQRRTGGRG